MSNVNCKQSRLGIIARWYRAILEFCCLSARYALTRIAPKLAILHTSFVAAAFSGLGLVFAPTPAEAGPFTCSGDIFQVQSGQLRIFDPIISQYVDVGPQNGSYNAAGFNTLDDFAYASQGQNVIRIHGDGTIETIFNVGFSSFAGDVDYNNTLWLRRSASRYDGVNLATGAVTPLQLTGSVQNAADVAFVQSGGTNYLIAPGSNFVGLVNLDNGTSTRTPITGMPSSGAFGASWTDSTGRLFTFHNNTGEIYELFDVFGTSATAVLVAQGDPSGNNDGFSCNTAPFPNLPPDAEDDEFTTPVNVAVSGSVLPDNGNGADSDPEGFGLTLNTTPVSQPSNGTVVLNADGSFTYTPNANFIGVDTFEYEISDVSGLTATATVTIMIDGSIGYVVAKNQVAGPNPVTAPGQQITYEITVDNQGDIPLTNVVAEDTLPDGSVVTLSGQTETGASDPGTAAPDVLDIGETWTYNYVYTVQPSDFDAGNLTNTVRVSTAEVDTVVLSDVAVTPITLIADWELSKTSSSTPAAAGDIVSYSFELENTGLSLIHI